MSIGYTLREMIPCWVQSCERCCLKSWSPKQDAALIRSRRNEVVDGTYCSLSHYTNSTICIVAFLSIPIQQFVSLFIIRCNDDVELLTWVTELPAPTWIVIISMLSLGLSHRWFLTSVVKPCNKSDQPLQRRPLTNDMRSGSSNFFDVMELWYSKLIFVDSKFIAKCPIKYSLCNTVTWSYWSTYNFTIWIWISKLYRTITADKTLILAHNFEDFS